MVTQGAWTSVLATKDVHDRCGEVLGGSMVVMSRIDQVRDGAPVAESHSERGR